jgi:hypothetical protein
MHSTLPGTTHGGSYCPHTLSARRNLGTGGFAWVFDATFLTGSRSTSILHMFGIHGKMASLSLGTSLKNYPQNDSLCSGIPSSPIV